MTSSVKYPNPFEENEPSTDSREIGEFREQVKGKQT